jgi:hypothetical protein
MCVSKFVHTIDGGLFTASEVSDLIVPHIGKLLRPYASTIGCHAGARAVFDDMQSRLQANHKCLLRWSTMEVSWPNF